MLAVSFAEFFMERWPEATIIAIISVVVTWFVMKMLDVASRTKHAQCKEHTEGLKDVLSSLTAIKSKTELIDNKTKEANCVANTLKLNETSAILREVRDNVVAINAFLTGKYERNAEFLSAKHSPRQLSPLGRKIFEDCGGKKFLELNIEKLIADLDSKKPATAYDVEKESFTILLMSSTEPEFNDLKNYIYNSPALKTADGKPYEVTLPDVCFVISLCLRDEFLKRHPEINPDDYPDITKNK